MERMIVRAVMSSEKWKNLLTEDPDNELVRFSLAKAFMDEHQWKDAIREFEMLVQAKKDYALAWAFLARCKLENGDREGARIAAETGLPIAHAQKHEVPTDEILAVIEELESDF
jgi:predicted Zn-dependent protease